jgi:hypothetical protein
MSVVLMAMEFRPSRRARVGRRLGRLGHQSSGGSGLSICGATPHWHEAALPRRMILLWHTGLQATQLLPRRTHVRLRAADTASSLRSLQVRWLLYLGQYSFRELRYPSKAVSSKTSCCICKQQTRTLDRLVSSTVGEVRPPFTLAC